MPRESRLEAKRVADCLATMPAIEAVCLFGSVARGDEHAASDIDLLVLGNRPGLTAATLLHRLPSDLDSNHLSIVYHTPKTLEQHLERWSRFRVHLRREGEILFDRRELLRGTLDAELPVRTLDELRQQLVHLRSFDHLDRFGGRFLFPMAHLYAIGRTVVFALLAERDTFEFNQNVAFERLADLSPEHAADVGRISRLRPFAELAAGHESDVLPFGFVDEASVCVASSRDAIRRLVASSQHADELADRAEAL